jgi:hypothetical protein
MRPYLKKEVRRKRSGDMALVLKYLFSKCKTPSSIPSTAKKKRKSKKEIQTL